jgi:hypothetical protein
MPDQEPALPGFVEPPRRETPAPARDPQEVRAGEFLKENADMLKLLDYGKCSEQEIRTRGLAQVARREYASGVLHHERPLHYEHVRQQRYGRWIYIPEKPGRLVHDAAKAIHEYGFDGDGRWVWARSFAEKVVDCRRINGRYTMIDPPMRAAVMEKFLFHQGDDVEGFCFGVDTFGLRYVFRQHFDGGRLRGLKYAQQVEDQPSFLFSENYEWEGGRIVRITTETSEKPFREDKTITYATNGKVQSIVDIIAGRALFAPPGQFGAAFVASLRQRLYDALVKAVTESGVKEPIYCLLLAYDTECDLPLPPEIGLGLERDRRRWIETMGAHDAQGCIWSVAEFSEHILDYVDAKLAEDCQKWNEHLQDKDSMAPAKKLVVNLAADLAKRDWSTCLNLTPDFVVVATDLPMDELDRNLKHSVPPERIAQLKKAGLL